MTKGQQAYELRSQGWSWLRVGVKLNYAHRPADSAYAIARRWALTHDKKFPPIKAGKRGKPKP